jgi:hypothetical protein
MDTPFNDFNNQIQYKFIRDTPKPFATKNKSFVIPSYSEMNTPQKSSRIYPSNNGMILEKPLPIIDKPAFTPNNIETPLNTENHLFNCRNIHSHILNCPVCSKIYKMNQNNLILFIVLLVLLLLILIKYLMK